MRQLKPLKTLKNLLDFRDTETNLLPNDPFISAPWKPRKPLAMSSMGCEQLPPHCTPAPRTMVSPVRRPSSPRPPPEDVLPGWRTTDRGLGRTRLLSWKLPNGDVLLHMRILQSINECSSTGKKCITMYHYVY